MSVSASSGGGSSKPKKKPTLPSTGSNGHPGPASYDPPSPGGGGGGGPSDSLLDPSKIRAYAACKSCRTKKIKCLPGPSTQKTSLDSNAPPGPCQQCLQSGSDCTYPPTRDRAAYSRQYVQNLESRVQALEMVQSRLAPLLEAFEGEAGVDMRAIAARAGASAGAGRGRRNGTGQGDGENGDDGEHDDIIKYEGLEDAAEGEDNHEADDSAAEDNVDDTGQMTQDERGNYRWIGTNNTLSLLDSFSATPSARTEHLPGGGVGAARPGNSYFAPVAGAGVIKALPTVDEVMYPAPELCEQFIDAYFAEIHPILPVMIEQDFRRGFATVMERRSRGQPEQSGIFISVIFAVFALGERVLVTSKAWTRERKRAADAASGKAADHGDSNVLPGEAEAGVVWYERAQILRYTTITDISLHQVQALTLMAAFQASVNAMPMSWLLCGMALRMAQDLGLHRSTARLRIPFHEKQVRARCWWAAYGLDRLVSLTLGRPVGVDDQDIDVGYPVDIDDQGLSHLHAEQGGSPTAVPPEPTTSVMSGFTALTKLCKIAGRINHALYRPSHGRTLQDPNWVASQQNLINKLDKSLRDWLDHEVPSKYKDPSSSRPIQLVSAVLSNSYFACLITLHRNFLPPSPGEGRPRAPPSSASLSHCVAAARSVIHIAAQSRVLLPPSHHLAVFCQYLWSAAVLLLLCEVQAKDQVVIDAVGSQVDSTRKSLRALEPVWPGTTKLKELLNEAEDRAKEVVAYERSGGRNRKRKSSADERGAKRPSLAGVKRSSSSSTGRNGRDNSPRGGAGARGVGGVTLNPPSNVGAAASATWRSPGQAGLPSLPGSMTSPSLTRFPANQYEMSDTRTNTISVDLGAGAGGGRGQGITFNNPSDSYGSASNANLSPVTATVNGTFNIPPPPDPQFTFDVGGVDFNGLEMLQGFGDFSSLWSSMINDQFGDGISPSMNTGAGVAGSNGAGGQAGAVGQGAGAGSGSGGHGMANMGPPTAMTTGVHTSPAGHAFTSHSNTGQAAEWFSPSGSDRARLTPGAQLTTPGGGPVPHGFPMGDTPTPGFLGNLPDLTSSEFWSSVAGAGQDWGADPNVPFNI